MCSYSDIVKDKEYQYRVQVEADGLLSELSPPLLYTHGAAYCGDGLLQGSVSLHSLHITDMSAFLSSNVDNTNSRMTMYLMYSSIHTIN